MKIEGYWYSDYEPNKKYPMPVPFDGVWDKKELFLNRLDKKEKKASVTRYRGLSKCRICGCFNGSEEFTLNGWKWPSGFKHYVKDHNVLPTTDFMLFICN